MYVSSFHSFAFNNTYFNHHIHRINGHFNYCLDVIIMPSPSRLLEQILYVLPVMLCFFFVRPKIIYFLFHSQVLACAVERFLWRIS